MYDSKNKQQMSISTTQEHKETIRQETVMNEQQVYKTLDEEQLFSWGLCTHSGVFYFKLSPLQYQEY